MPKASHCACKRRFTCQRPIKAVLAGMVVFAACSTQATTVLNTFAGPGTTAEGGWWSLGGDQDPHAGSSGEAVRFDLVSVVTIGSVVTTIEGTGTVSLSIVRDMPGFEPGTSSPTGPTYFSRNLTNPTSKTVLDGLSVTLAAGRYWLVALEAPGLTFTGGWQGGGASVSSPWALYNSRLGWADWGPENPPAALITSTVPEPGTGALMVIALAAAGFAALGRNVRSRDGLKASGRRVSASSKYGVGACP